MVSWGGIILNLTLVVVLVFFAAMVIGSYSSLKVCENNESTFCPPSLCAGMHYNPQMIVYDYNTDSNGITAAVSPIDVYCSNPDNTCSNGMPISIALVRS